ncbi:MAG: J domain-containing protein [Bacteriovorax sp.]|nr:J domain-containing protein [Bacteriovorax sp.]
MEKFNNNTAEKKPMSPWSFLFVVFLGIFYYLVAFILTIGPAMLSTYLFRKMDKKLTKYGVIKAEKKYADVYAVICQASLYLSGIFTFLRIIIGDDKIKNAITIPERIAHLDYWAIEIIFTLFIFLPAFCFYTSRVVKSFKSVKDESKSETKKDAKLKNWDSDSFEILDVPRTASVSEIKKAYYKVVGQYHPDKVASLAPEFKAMAEDKSKIINHAYEECLKKVG